MGMPRHPNPCRSICIRAAAARTKTAIFCPRCHKNHLLSRIWAWLDNNDPKVVVTDAVPRVPPVVQN